MGREVKARMPGEPAANRGRLANRCSVGASWLGLAKREACCGNDDVDELGLSARQRVAEVIASARRKNIGVVEMWTTTSIPLPIQQQLTARGSKPIELRLHEHGDRRLAVIVSHDPSGLNGATEIHASISASVCGLRIRPDANDVRLTVRELGFDWK